jgi:hypothetical protein
MNFFSVMAGLVPAIHVFLGLNEGRTWMPGTRPGMTDFRQTRLSVPQRVFVDA